MDKRGVLEKEVFSYRITKDQKVLISYEGKPVRTLSGSNAKSLIAKIQGANGQSIQLMLAKATGNFKRGNEKEARNKCLKH